jgi:uncharacterized DUF497 family protein
VEFHGAQKIIKKLGVSQCKQILAENDQTHAFCGHQVIDRILNVSTLNLEISFDQSKSDRNMLLRGLSFTLASQFEWSTSIISADLRHDYGEARYLAMGFLEERLHVLVFTPREQAVHIISLRRANSREVRLYAKETKS